MTMFPARLKLKAGGNSILTRRRWASVVSAVRGALISISPIHLQLIPACGPKLLELFRGTALTDDGSLEKAGFQLLRKSAAK